MPLPRQAGVAFVKSQKARFSYDTEDTVDTFMSTQDAGRIRRCDQPTSVVFFYCTNDLPTVSLVLGALESFNIARGGRDHEHIDLCLSQLANARPGKTRLIAT